MKKIIFAVSVTVCFASCTSDERVRELYTIQLHYEEAVHEWENAKKDSTYTSGDIEVCEAEVKELRRKFLNRYGNLSERNRQHYAKFVSAMQSADMDYLGSCYEEEEPEEQKNLVPLNSYVSFRAN